MGGVSQQLSCVSSHDPPATRRADNLVVAENDFSTPQCDHGPAGDLPTLVHGVIRIGLEHRRIDTARQLRIEDYDMRVAANCDRTHAWKESKELGCVGGQHFDESTQRDAAVRTPSE